MEITAIELTKGEEETIKKALRFYHYHLTYQCQAALKKPKKYPHPIDNYLQKEAETAKQLLIGFEQ
jgi:hypothetical protein